ncbi:calmodulin-binding receptor-like cytoplasmic kinase 2 [Aristolochia californica]|uniref:calmodulin-binding receptor-like cytoplasmic kinase 2 n=1 Tax=Aristolochia californica TaxID=171875 RepID=UPI0035E2AC86
MESVLGFRLPCSADDCTMKNSHSSPSAREIYEGWRTGSTDFTRSYGYSGSYGDSGPADTKKPSFSGREIYEGNQRTPGTPLVSLVSDGYLASGEHLSARRPKGILSRLTGGCFKPWNIGTVYNVRNHRAYSEERGFRFTASEVYRATRNFSPSCKIGHGSFGDVYRGRLDDGTYVAVKRGKKAMNDEPLCLEFQDAVQTLARTKHLNLVEFLGYLDHEDKIIIIEEYVTNGTLREHLDGLYGTGLDLAARLNVAIDVAYAVTYLHMDTGHPIIHQGIKASNILITENFRAKVSYCEPACLAETGRGATYYSTHVIGTPGYLDPESFITYKLTEKSDVYSFGVLLVELVSGRRAIESNKQPKEQTTARWAGEKFAKGDALLVLDPKLPRNTATNFALVRILELALNCLVPTRQSRPSMQKCVESLLSIRKDYSEISAMDVRSQSIGFQKGSSIKKE